MRSQLGLKSRNSCPVIVCDVSDSDDQLAAYREGVQLSIAHLSNQFSVVAKTLLKIRYSLADAEDAECNAFVQTFKHSRGVTYFMCFFHLVAYVTKRTRTLRDYATAQVYRGIFDMCDSRSREEFDEVKVPELHAWSESRELKAFRGYFNAYGSIDCFHSEIAI